MSDNRPPSSPPCDQAALEMSTMDPAILAGRLNELLEGERAGARGLMAIKHAAEPELATLLDEVERDEARFCSMLRKQVARLGFEPSRTTGVFYDKLLARTTLVDQLRLLDRGQSAVVRVLEQLLPEIRDRELKEALDEMRIVHIRNIERCARHLPN
jgi:hypothetical protein